MNWSKIKPVLIPFLIVVVALVVYSQITRNVEVDDKGKVVDGGKQYKTKFRFAISKKKA